MYVNEYSSGLFAHTHMSCYHVIADFWRFFMTKMLPNATTPKAGHFGKHKLQSPSPFDSKKQRLTNGLFHSVLYPGRRGFAK